MKKTMGSSRETRLLTPRPRIPRKTGWQLETGRPVEPQTSPSTTHRVPHTTTHGRGVEEGELEYGVASGTVCGMQVLAGDDWPVASRTGPEFPAAPATNGTLDWLRGYAGLAREGPLVRLEGLAGWHDLDGDRPAARKRADRETAEGMIGCASITAEGRGHRRSELPGARLEEDLY